MAMSTPCNSSWNTTDDALRCVFFGKVEKVYVSDIFFEAPCAFDRDGAQF